MNISIENFSVFKVSAKSGTILLNPPSPPPDMKQEGVIAIFSLASSVFDKTYAEWEHSISNPGEYEMEGVRIVGIASPSSESGRINTIYSVQTEGLNTISLGELGGTPDMSRLQALEPVDVLIVDVEKSSLNIAELSSVVNSLEPSAIVLNGLDPETEAPSQKLVALLSDIGSGGGILEPMRGFTITSSAGADGDRKISVLAPR